jgi:predicted DNA-binding antitoxin AbrB/MazE fold protein
MSMTAECVIELGMIKLPKSLRLPDGIRVVVNIEPSKRIAQRKKMLLELAGSWRNDATISSIFSEIAEERSSYFGRDVSIP